MYMSKLKKENARLEIEIHMTKIISIALKLTKNLQGSDISY